MFERVLCLSSLLFLVLAGPLAAEEKVDYEKQIQPIFAQHCAGCHGEKMAGGKLRLHTSTALKEKWDADAHLIVVGDPDKSELYTRLVLPADHKKRMPKKADPLPKEKIDLIAQWIREGAVLAAAAAATPAEAKPAEAPAEEKPAEAAPEKPEPAEIPLPEVAPAPQEAIDKVAATGAQVMPLYADSPLLQVSFAHRSEPVSDAELALLAGIADQVYALNLADGKFTDAGLASLAALKNLAVLHVERSAITDAGLAHLAGLNNLQYLNLYGTAITDAAIPHIKNLKNLRRLYLWQTKVSYDPAMSLEKDVAGLVVNLGYDHPGVVRVRLTKELETVKKQAEEAKAEEAKVQQQLEAAKKEAEAAAARLAEIEKQLKELEAPAAAEQKAEPAAPAATTTTEAKPAEAPQAAN